jgi:class 3 adenylate cyclase
MSMVLRKRPASMDTNLAFSWDFLECHTSENALAEERVQHRLAAILAVDVAGYSRLMRQDLEGTLAAFTGHLNDMIAPCIGRFRGRVVKTTGDGVPRQH